MTTFDSNLLLVVTSLVVLLYWAYRTQLRIKGAVTICAVRARTERVGSGWATKTFVLYRIHEGSALYAILMDVPVDSPEHALDLFSARYRALPFLRHASKRRDDLAPSLRLPSPSVAGGTLSEEISP